MRRLTRLGRHGHHQRSAGSRASSVTRDSDGAPGSLDRASRIDTRVDLTTGAYFACSEEVHAGSAGARGVTKRAVGGRQRACWRRRSRMAQQAQAPPPPDDPIATLVGRLELERYKATIKGLTQFGDRREGTQRNRDAVDWIEAQLKSYGCTNTERITYTYRRRGVGAGARQRRRRAVAGGPRRRWRGRGAGRQAGAGGRRRAAGRRGRARAARRRRRSAVAARRPRARLSAAGRARCATVPGGSTLYGNRGRTGVNNNAASAARRDAARAQRRAGAARRSAPAGLLHEDRHDATRTRCTSSARTWTASATAKPRTTTASGTALVMELARIFSSPDVHDRAIDSLRALERRRGRSARRRRVRRPAPGRCRARRIRRAPAGIPSRSGSA